MELRYYLAYILVFLFVIMFTVMMIYFLTGLVSSAPFVTSRKNLAKELAVYIKNNLPPGSVVYELGSGIGTVLLEMAKANPDKKFIGIEINWPLNLVTNARKIMNGLGNVEVKTASFFNHDLSNADGIFMYLLPKVIKKLELKLKAEKKPSTVIFSNVFELKSFTEIKRIKFPKNGMSRELIIYK
jgi:precorrin-6B methylase 2